MFTRVVFVGALLLALLGGHRLSFADDLSALKKDQSIADFCK